MFSTRGDFALGNIDGIQVVSPVQNENQASRFLKSIGQNLLHGINGRNTGVAPFASISSSGIGLVPKLEKRTGTDFPETFCHISRKDCPALIGTGARSKRLAGIKNIDVYAMGFYIDTGAAKGELGRDFDCLPPGSLEHNQALAERLMLSNNIEKNIRIVVTSSMVNQARFSKGLRESLEPRVKQTGDLAALDEFEGLFNGAQFYKGLEMSFSNTKEGSLALRIGNKEVGQVDSPGFTRAFFDLYLGTDPVSQDGKASIAKGLAAVISKAGSEK
ncbi:hypothetical protein WJX75_005569 [Coccomyxa subellipsoidea]|uniref:Chalcone isomerase domain-containing protein n=1 Tax=Coccomyxa subellipsoidea TaxID=248742 RepID=A0ABR2YRW0_9CHLO